MILFFDTYIISKDNYFNSVKNKQFDSNVRKASYYRFNNHKYKFKSKLEVTKYTLLSYSIINWSDVIIRFECEDSKDIKEFTIFCKKHFPNALIENTRSDTSEKFYNALKRLTNKGNPWVWFCINNDHPYLSNPNKLSNLIDAANYYEKKYDKDVSILYSHFSESMNNYSFHQFLYRYYNLNGQRKIIEKNDHLLILSERFLIDSIRIFRLNLILEAFKETTSDKRVIRLEDTKNYMINKNLLTVVPKNELCRHYDSYSFDEKFQNSSFADKVPPLFIPEGIFEKKLKIYYGYNKYKIDYININPNMTNQEIINQKTDMICRIENIPFFWKERIESLNVNEDFLLKKDHVDYDLLYLKNPFLNEKKYKYFFINLKRLLFFWFKLILTKLKLYKYLKNLITLSNS